MTYIKEDFSELEQKLESIDFYNELADRDGMLRDFINVLDSRDMHSKPALHRRIARPLAIAAVIATLILATGLTVFADSIKGLLMQLGFTGGIVNQVDQLSGEHPKNVSEILTFHGSDITYDPDVEWQDYMFSSLAEAKDSMCFTLLEPKGLSDNWRLESIRGLSDGMNIDPTWVELIYTDLNTAMPSHMIPETEEIPQRASIYVYQQFLGDGATMEIDTTCDIRTISLNGIEAVLIGPHTYDWANAYSLTWVQDGIRIDICPLRCTYDELISFAERYIE